MLLLGGLMLSSCSKEDDDTSSSTLIKQYGLTGKYRFMIVPTIMGTVPVTAGTVDGTITEESNGVLRLRFKGFRASPMPFEMTVDAQFTITESANGLTVHNVDGKGFFDADPPEGGANPDDDPGFQIPEESLEKGLHSNGNSKISGVYKNSTKQMELELDPAVQLPVIIKINTVQKLN